MENPVASSFIFSLVRAGSGYLQKKWKEKTGEEFDKKQLGATILKYEVATNSIFAVVPPQYAGAIAPLVTLADIIYSAAKKLKNGKFVG